MSCKEDSNITGFQKLLIRKLTGITLTANVWVPTTLLKSEMALSYSLFSPPPSKQVAKRVA
jgi:hypothetical protein